VSAASRQLAERAQAELDGAGPRVLERVAGELFQVAALLTHELRLRRVLADPSLPRENKRGLLDQLLGEQAHELTMRELDVLVTGGGDDVEVPRLAPVVLVDLIEQLGAQAIFTRADADGSLDDVEDELFRLSRLVAREHGLRAALTAIDLPDERKLALLDALLEGKANPLTMRLVRVVVTAQRGRTVERALEDLARLAAAHRGRIIAEVTTAGPLDAERTERLRDVLTRLQGRPVRLQVVVDPSILAGVVVRIGDEIIDGSARRQLERVRTQLA
jgi:F-type H+-transporting ATPase subunit delta